MQFKENFLIRWNIPAKAKMLMNMISMQFSILEIILNEIKRWIMFDLKNLMINDETITITW